ncbi:MAG: YXWGXW repeat-containing protein [Deltaproteobacteria bacterium]|nr:YXWGXW repeat-containing protein [Deltaproteobacteria bacterium]
MNRRIFTMAVALVVIFFLSTIASAFPPHPKRPIKRPIVRKHLFVPAPLPLKPPPPAAGFIWIERYKHASGVYIGGFWRPAAKEGFVWTDGVWSDDGQWTPGHWAPVKAKPGFFWVPGYWNGAVWVEGYWRPSVNQGHGWIPGHYDDSGFWLAGHWERRQ